MINIKKLNRTFISGWLKPATPLNTNTKRGTTKLNSLAYLAYKNRKQKGLIPNDKNECPTIYFGDEWAF